MTEEEAPHGNKEAIVSHHQLLGMRWNDHRAQNPLFRARNIATFRIPRF